MELVNKKKSTVVKDHWEDEDFQTAFDYAAYLMALEELNAHDKLIERELDKALREGNSKEVKKYQRAIIKTYAKTGDPRALELMEVIKHKPGGKDHDQKDHGKWAHEGASQSQPGVTGVGQDVFNFARLIAVPEKLAGGIAHAADHMSDFLGSSSWGRKLKSAGSFVLGKAGGNKIQMASELSGKYGPAAARSMLRGYYRYKGHDVPVDLDFKTGEDREGARNRVITELGKRIPEDRAANELKSVGSFPPSEGYVINSRGEIVARGLGKAKDEYTPFDFKHFKDMRGGSLVRRRVWGGPSKEDFHLAMLTGARDLTTVSRNGTFTIELTDEARKNRGLHLDHPRIINRWTQLQKAGKKNNGPGVQAKLEALKAEYPLHFGEIKANIAQGRDGEWEEVSGGGGGLLSAVFGGGERSSSRGGGHGGGGGSPSQQRATPIRPSGSGSSMLESPRFRDRNSESETAVYPEGADLGSGQRAWSRWGDAEPALKDMLEDQGFEFDDDADMDYVAAEVEEALGFSIQS